MKWFGHGRQQNKAKNQSQESGLFSTLSVRERRIVDGFMYKRQFLAGEVVFDAGEEGQALYVIESGLVAIMQPGDSGKVLVELSSQDYFGELGLLDGYPRSAQAKASSVAELSVLSRSDFEKLMESQAHIASKIALQLARHLGQRMRQTLIRNDAVGSVQ